MITKINISNIATFTATPQIIDNLKKINFFFGVNGTGKTTISKIIDDPSQFQNCTITWENGFELDKRVYNRDFVERNFQSSLKGIFTLGETEIDISDMIKAVKTEIDELTNQIKTLSISLEGEDSKGGKINDLAQIETEYNERFWSSKQKHDTKLAGAMKGVLNDKVKFKEKVLYEVLNNQTELKALVDLETRAAKVFSDVPLLEAQIISSINIEKLPSLEQSSVLKKRVIGKDDVDIAAIIKKLDNSDWVRQGISFYEANDGVCPFCQQNTTESFSKSLAEYFDDAFEKDNASINRLVSDYTTESSRIQQSIQAIIELHSEFVDNEKLEKEKKLLDSIITGNVQRLAQKKKETSQIIELDSLKNVLDAVVTIITSANEKINAHNAIIQNLSNEKKTLTNETWRFIVEELKTDIADYSSKKKNVNEAIDSIKTQIKSKNEEKNIKEATLRNLEKQTVSIQPTLDGINGLLSSFGFKSFSLAKGNDNKTYKLVRANGLDAQNTLSEGERNFVTFLYFYYLLKGSHSESGMTTNKIVVFDDPVSSLDSDIMFIVSSLIRELFDDVRKRDGTIKQIFVLTHNVYFHKEVSYNSKRNKDRVLNEESFWLVKKQESDSFVELQESNPIKTSYELLWEEVRSEKRNNITIRNTLRRILENYFKLLGGISLDNLYTKFDGDNKILCKSLCSWLHDGSHNVFNDDHYTVLDDTAVERYLDVFKQIFEKCKQIAHYNMMMSIDSEPDETLEEEMLPSLDENISVSGRKKSEKTKQQSKKTIDIRNQFELDFIETKPEETTTA